MTDTDRLGDRPLTYRDAGVDIDAGNALVSGIKRFAESTARPGADGRLGGFGGLFDLKAAGYRDPILVAANDGVGTKLKIAIETGKHDTVGIDLVAMCVNDLVVQAAEPLFFLDYFATGHLEVGVAEAVVAGIAEGCRQAGCALIGGETAEMPGMYAAGDYDLAGFAVGAAERDALLPRADINEGDAIIGIASSGVHANGFSLVRRLLADVGLGWDSLAPFADGQTFGEALLTPTTIYVRALQSALSATGGVSPSGTIKAISHITGGGLDENIPRVLPATVAARIDLETWSPPSVFQWIADNARLDQAEMLRTFNCGIGMVVIADAAHTSSTVAALKAAGVDAWVIGDIAAPAGARSEAKGRGDAWIITYRGALF